MAQDAAPTSIAVLRMSALGDVVMTLPLLRTLQKAFPRAKLYWIVARPFHAIVEGVSGVELIVIDKPRGPLSYWRLWRQLRAYSFDWLLAPQASMRANLVMSATRAGRKIGFGALHSRDLQRWFVDEFVPAEPEHLIDSFLRFATYVGAREHVLEWGLPLKPEEHDWARAQVTNARGIKLAVVLAASKAERNWPVERYREALNRVAARWPLTVVLIGGPGEGERRLAAELREGLVPAVLDLVGQTSLRQLAALLGQVDALLAPDTGPLHIAQAMNKPVVGLYAVAPSKKTGPYLEPQWTVDVFDEAAATILGRERMGWRQRVHDERALRLITVDAVVGKMEKLFEHRGFKRLANP
ncbi:MAG: glycosyltransferase family 9 protein [Betaproteobacteria bacterium]|nr:glycosyltransferase family 9 protein [Betaproteobacteria bacterium]